MNLHLMHDEKFIDRFIQVWEQHDRAINNLYLVYNRPDKSRLRHISSPRVVCCEWGTPACRTIVDQARQFDKIFVHFLDARLYRYVASFPVGVKVLWVFWGGDYFAGRQEREAHLFDEETMQYLRFRESSRSMVHLRRAKHTVQDWWLEIQKRKAIARVDYLLHWNRLDFELIKSNYPLRANFLPFAYDGGTLGEKRCDEGYQNADLFQGRKVVLLGNSATPSNNHISMIHLLSRISLPRDVLVVAPLSYGDEKYADHISRLGLEILGERFLALREFLPLADYNRLLSRSDVGIMNHRRTQAGANVMGLLREGRRVFMNEVSTLYQMLAKNGVAVSPTRDLRSSEALFEPVCERVVEHTRSLLYRLFGPEFHHRALSRIASIY
jgi:hypothetical protein